MSTFKPYQSIIEAPSLTDVQALPGLVLLEFGTEWCGYCRAAQALIAQALAMPKTTQWQHLKIEDGPGRVLGRSYRVKLWPTLVLLRDGQEVGRLMRPATAAEIETAMAKA
jgi:thioredoxin 1